MLNKYAVRYVIVEQPAPAVPAWQGHVPPPSQMLRQVLAGEGFVLVTGYRLACDDPAWRDVYLYVYRNQRAQLRSANHLSLPIPSMGRKVTIRLP